MRGGTIHRAGHFAASTGARASCMPGRLRRGPQRARGRRGLFAGRQQARGVRAGSAQAAGRVVGGRTGAFGHGGRVSDDGGVRAAGDGVTREPESDAETMEVNGGSAMRMLGLAANGFRIAGRGQSAGICSIAGDRGRSGNPARRRL
mgnify:CR=1 FL=1